jgi:hypothetical protein
MPVLRASFLRLASGDAPVMDFFMHREQVGEIAECAL